MSSLNCLQMRPGLTFTTAFTAPVPLVYRLECPAIKSQGCGWGPSCLCVLASTLLQALCRVKIILAQCLLRLRAARWRPLSGFIQQLRALWVRCLLCSGLAAQPGILGSSWASHPHTAHPASRPSWQEMKTSFRAS